MPAISSDALIRIAAIVLIIAFVAGIWLTARRSSDAASPTQLLLHMCFR